MILRKPYAVFIKYFRVLHVIIGLLSAALLYNSFTLYRFFNLYSIDYRSALSNYSPGQFVNLLIYFFAVVSLILSIVLLSVMIYKDKPKRLYIFNVLLFIGILIFYSISNSFLEGINNVILDIKVSKAIRDFALIACLLQAVSVIFTFIRATGFDIKQFEFGSDLEKLNISDVDSEEIEVAINFDKDELKRNFKAFLRNIKYVYFEHKFVINVIVLIFVFSVTFLVYHNVRLYSAEVGQGKVFDVSNVTLNIQDSFILEDDPNGNALTETEGDYAGAIVAVRFQVKSYGVKQKLNTGLFTLRIGDLSYGQNSSIASELYDLGTSYDNQQLSDEYETYILAFDVAKSQSNKKMKLKINDNFSFIKGVQGAKSYYVSLEPQDLRKDGEVISKKIGDVVNFDDSILGSSSLNINSFEINDKFKLGYKFCYAKDKCMDSYEYVTPTATGDNFKTLMRINCILLIDSNLNVLDIYDLRTFLNNFGYISYKYKDVFYTVKIDSEVIKPLNAKTDDYFIEVPLEVKESDEIYLSFKIRNQNYKYTLK